MDPLTAIGFASNVIAFVDFTAKLLSTAHSLYVSASGTTADNLELETLAGHIQLLAAKAASPSLQPNTRLLLSTEDAALYDLGKQCGEVSQDLLTLLNSFKVEGSHKKWKSIYQALRTTRHSGKIDTIQKRLDRIGAQMSAHMLIQRQDELLKKLESIESENQRLGINREGDIIRLRTDMTGMFEKISQERRDDGAKVDTLVQLISHAEKFSRFSHEQDVLSILRFDGMNDRQTAINPAHAATFSWVFGDDSPGHTSSPTDSFANWLQSNESLYWISGKPGSGKSTFMKYVCGHTLLRERLQVWAGSQTLVVASFFFWNLGRQDLQKSQEGLLRSVLYQILRQQPDLVEHVYPAQQGRDIKGIDFSGNSIPVVELLAAIQRIPIGLATSKIKYCFFIDGLDEYEGKPNDIIRLIELLKSSLQVKVCVASRPWNEFEKVFGQDDSRKLYMQNLTRDDIEAYVHDTFEKDSSFQDLMEMNEESLDFINEIVNSANGVFLWVHLVVQSLLEGMTNADRIVDLRRRLHSLPTDLNEFFKHIIFTVDGFYQQQTAHFFQVTLLAHVTLPLMCYWFMDQDIDNDEPEFALKLKIQPLTMQKTRICLKQMRKRLNACCKGLLEVQFYDSSDDSGNSDSSLPSSVLFNWKVDFLHRTARDFLRTPDMQQQLDKWTASNFSADTMICGAILAQVKTAPQEEEYFKDDGPVNKLVAAFHSHMSFIYRDQEDDSDAATKADCQAALKSELGAVFHEQRSRFAVTNEPSPSSPLVSNTESSLSKRLLRHFWSR